MCTVCPTHESFSLKALFWEKILRLSENAKEEKFQQRELTTQNKDIILDLITVNISLDLKSLVKQKKINPYDNRLFFYSFSGKIFDGF